MPSHSLPQLLPGLAIIQIAVVVHDLESHAARQSDLLGAGPWRIYEFGPHMMTWYEDHGSPAVGRTLVALNDTRPQVELLQPVSGPSIYQAWLGEHGEGLHHVGVVVDSVDAVVAAAQGLGIDILSSGAGFGVDGSGKFAYLETRAQIGMIVEVIEPPTSLGEPLRCL